MRRSTWGASRYDVRIGGGSWKSRRSKGGCSNFIAQIRSKCGHHIRKLPFLPLPLGGALEAKTAALKSVGMGDWEYLKTSKLPDSGNEGQVPTRAPSLTQSRFCFWLLLGLHKYTYCTADSLGD